MDPSNIDEKKERREVPKSAVASTEFSQIHSSIADIISDHNHSKDFIQTRKSYIVERLRLMCLFFAISVPASFLLDIIVFESEQAKLLFANRIILSISLFILYKTIQRINTVGSTRIVLALSFLFPVLFYISTSVSLATIQHSNEIPLSFSMMPYLIVAMLGLFPLTILSGMVLLTVIAGPLLVFEYMQSAGNYVGFIDKFWLLMLFGGISLWLQSGQLVMLMKLYRESTIDPLTGLINRRVLMRQVAIVSGKCREDNDYFSVMMFDLDHFKRVNDTFGHMTGDQVLIKIAAILKRELRNSDVIARFGGEEFLVVMPHLQLEQAVHVAQRVADAIRNSSVKSEDQQRITFTASVGVTQYRINESVDTLFKRVDDLLYMAKDQGRDRVVCDQLPESVETRQAS